MLPTNSLSRRFGKKKKAGEPVEIKVHLSGGKVKRLQAIATKRKLGSVEELARIVLQETILATLF